MLFYAEKKIPQYSIYAHRIGKNTCLSYTDKGLVSRKYNELLQLNKKDQ